MTQPNRFFTTFPGAVTGGENLFVYPSPKTTRSPQGTTDRFHRHTFYEIVWLAQGSATFICDFQEYTLDAGTVVFIAPGQLHTWEGDWSAFDLILFGFKPSLLSQYSYAPGFLSELPFFDIAAVPLLDTQAASFALFDTLFKTALIRFKDVQHADEQLLLGYLNIILLEARRLYQVAPSPRAGSAATQITRAFRRAVEARFFERWQVQDYADSLGVTLNHLVETVRQTTGLTPKQIIQSRLMLEAKRLLLATADPVGEISTALGFESQSYFGQWFKTIEGCTPGEFRGRFQTP
jgi:AraC-like DNA-binding protein